MPPQDPKTATMDPSGRYRLLRKLGSGGMAEVHLALMRGEAGFEKQVVLKRILPQHSRDAEFVARLIREGRIVALMNHSNIVQVLELGQWDGEYYLSMEHVDGCDLRQLEEQLSRSGQPFPLAPAIQILLSVARALDYAHSLCDREGRPLGVVHRDISPANVLISRHGEVKLADFGIARWEDEESLRTAAGHLRGKLPYISPEQVEGRAPDARSDLFSFGVLAYELLSSGRPFDGDTTLRTLENIRQVRHKPLAQLQPSLDPELSALVEACLELDPTRRPEAASRLVLALETLATRHGAGAASSQLARLVGDCLAQTPPPEEPLPGPGRHTESVVFRARPRPAFWALGLLLILLLLGGSALTLKLVLDWHGSKVAPAALAIPHPNPDRKGAGQPPGLQPAPAPAQPRPSAPAIPVVPTPPPAPAPVPPSEAPPSTPAPAEPIPEAVPDATSDAAPDVVPEVAPGAAPDAAPTPAQGVAPEYSVTKLTVVPRRALILADGQRLGAGEALVRLEAGQSVQVQLEAPGFEAQTFELTYPAPRKLHKSLKALATGALKLRYFPSDAKVLLDGQPLETSPELNIIAVTTTPGEHLLRVEAPEGRFVEQRVLVEADQEKGLTVTVE